MRRVIDKLPAPSDVKSIKVIGLGPSRTGTMGLWLALRILGYHPHHIGDSLRAGVQQMKALHEAIAAADTADPLTPLEIAKIWGEYDARDSLADLWCKVSRLESYTDTDSQCLIESPCYLGMSVLETFLADPDTKFILTERSPESFLKSVSGAQCRYWEKLSSWKLFPARLADPFLWELERILKIQIARWSGGAMPQDPEFAANVKRNYTEYNEMVKHKVPSERLLVLSLEKGFGWDDLCGFLGQKVPDTPFPRVWTMAEFQGASDKRVAREIRKSVICLSVVGMMFAAFGLWYFKLRKSSCNFGT